MFQTLKTLGWVVEILGWVLVIISGIYLVYTQFSGSAFAKENFFQLVFLPCAVIIIIGIIVVSYGQAIQCFVSLHDNAKETNRLLGDILRTLGGGRRLEMSQPLRPCIKCGAPLDKDSIYCDSCGTRVSV